MQILHQKLCGLWRRYSPMMVGLLFLLPLGGCSQNWGWYVVNPATPAGQRNLKFLIDGLYYTIALSLTAITISIIVGLMIALPGLSSRRVPRGINRVYVEMVRAIPILVMILWVYYGLPQVAGISISVFWAGVLALAISDSAFQAEIFRAGIQSINRRANELVVTEYRPLEIYTVLVLEYLVVILIVSAGVRWLERRLNAAD